MFLMQSHDVWGELCQLGSEHNICPYSKNELMFTQAH